MLICQQQYSMKYEAISSQTENESIQVQAVHVINGSSSMQSFFFTWVHSMLQKNIKEGQTAQYLPILPKQYLTENQHNSFLRIWQSLPSNSPQGCKLIKALILNYKSELIGALLLLIGVVVLCVAQPLISSHNIDYIQNRPIDISYGILLFSTTIAIQIINKLCFNQLNYRFSILGVRIYNTINTMIYQKSLKLSTSANKRFSEAEIINYSQTDAQRMASVGFQLSSLLYGPFQIIFSLTMMYLYVGVSCLVGVFVIVVILFLNFFVSKRLNRLNEEVNNAKDNRMHTTTEEMLSIIRFIKINAIQKFFFSKIAKDRRVQIGFYLQKTITFWFTVMMYWLTCPLLLSATFLTYVALGNQLSPQVAFIMIMLANIMEQPIHSLPNAVSELIQIVASLKRIKHFLMAEEIDSSLIVRQHETNHAIKIINGNFYWGKSERSENDKQRNIDKRDGQDIQQEQEEDKNKTENFHVLKDINLTIQKGKFVMIIGDIGSGKSSLLQAILNQMIHHQDSKVFLSGSIAYSAQKPWIMSKTVKENIAFNLPYDQEKFNKVIYHSSFQNDLKILPQGAETEIGEKGINISGGQKARLSLARVLYSQKDICLLDDILSAVDVHVGDFLMKQTLKGYLKGKTILMPTHALRYIEQADEIIIMKNGNIVQKGSFNDICNSAQYQQISEKEAEHEQQEKNIEQKIKGKQIQLAKFDQFIKEQPHFLQKLDSEEKMKKQIVQGLILPENIEKNQINWKIFKLFINNCGGFGKFLIPTIICMICWITCRTLSSIFIEKQCQQSSKNNFNLFLFVICVLSSNVFILLRTLVTSFSSAKQGILVHNNTIKSLLYADLSKFFNRVPVGRILNRLTKDLRELDEDLVDEMSWFMVACLELLSTLTICIYASSILSVIPMIIVGIISSLLRKHYMKAQRQLVRHQKNTNSPVLSGFVSTMHGLSSIRAYKAYHYFMDQQMNSIDRSKRVRMAKTGLQNWFNNVLNMVTFIINLPCIAYCMFSNNSNPSLIGLLMVYSLILCDNITHISRASANFQTSLISLQRIYNFMNIEAEQGYKQYCQEWQEQEQGGRQVIESGSLEFSQVSASYRKDLPNVLKSISCKIVAGQKIGIVGRTGAGKSTIINTLLRITKISSGKIMIDGKNLRDFSLKDLRYSITMIDQEPTLINSTFRQNLDITDTFSEYQVQKILRECNLLEVINEKGGLNGMVSNSSLSAGEKQLLCICRAFLKQSKIVLIDEATANIDVKNDAIIQKVIAEKFKDSTVLTIAHRLSTLKNADKIMVLEKGELIEFGEPGQLERRQGGFYAEMIKKNFAELFS